MASPVRGLMPLRAARLVTMKVPKPASWTLPFFFSEEPMVSSSAVTVATGTLQEHARIIGRVYFPRIALPLAPILSGLLDLALDVALFDGGLCSAQGVDLFNIFHRPAFDLVGQVFDQVGPGHRHDRGQAARNEPVADAA